VTRCSAAVAAAVAAAAAAAAVLRWVQDDFVEVGMISRPHGVRGEVKVQLITDEPKKRLGTAGKR
jgi:ribosomal protein L35AE/L33A